jgi:hypothetical protein
MTTIKIKHIVFLFGTIFFIIFSNILLRAATDEKPLKTALAGGIPVMKEYEKGKEWTGWLLLAIDAGLAGWGGYAIYDNAKAANDYDKLYYAIDFQYTSKQPGQTHDEYMAVAYANYNRLLKEKQNLETKKTIATASVLISIAAVLYTIMDANGTHVFFPKEVKTSYDFHENRFEIVICRGF